MARQNRASGPLRSTWLRTTLLILPHPHHPVHRSAVSRCSPAYRPGMNAMDSDLDETRGTWPPPRPTPAMHGGKPSGWPVLRLPWARPLATGPTPAMPFTVHSVRPVPSRFPGARTRRNPQTGPRRTASPPSSALRLALCACPHPCPTVPPPSDLQIAANSSKIVPRAEPRGLPCVPFLAANIRKNPIVSPELFAGGGGSAAPFSPPPPANNSAGRLFDPVNPFRLGVILHQTNRPPGVTNTRNPTLDVSLRTFAPGRRPWFPNESLRRLRRTKCVTNRYSYRSFANQGPAVG
jgi:hypothetical protein